MLTGSSPPSILSKSDLSVPCPFPGVDVLPVEIIYPKFQTQHTKNLILQAIRIHNSQMYISNMLRKILHFTVDSAEHSQNLLVIDHKIDLFTVSKIFLSEVKGSRVDMASSLQQEKPKTVP